MRRIRFIATIVLATAFLVVPLVCQGSSGSTWNVTVNNTSPVRAWVRAGYLKGLTFEYVDAFVDPSSTVTLKIPGAACPQGVMGRYWAGDHWLDLKPASCLGHDVGTSAWTACCWNVTFEICRKAGQEGDQFRDGDFGFCKR